MKILFFSHMSGIITKNKYPGGNWISSLINQISSYPDIAVGIVAFGENTEFKQVHNNITEYNLQSKRSNIITKFVYNITHSIFETKDINQYRTIVNDFSPDIIYVFGTESEHAFHLSNINIPLIIHIQGIMQPCLSKWFPSGINNTNVFFSNNLFKTLRGSGLFHDYYRHKKLALRESLILKNVKYITGRTNWDKIILEQLAPNANYFHSNEVLRNEFEKYSWNYFHSEEIILTTIMNENTYKGLDTIFSAALLLNEQDIKYTWNIIGISNESQLIKLFRPKVRGKLSELSVNFCGTKKSDEIINILLKSNLYINSSHIDNSPNSICEAMSLGIPVISSDVGGISTLITHNEDGILYPDGDYFTLVYYIKSLITDSEKQLKLSRNSRILKKVIKEDI
jgi:glycosyltransferase involved in cell wall biosynthesis